MEISNQFAGVLTLLIGVASGIYFGWTLIRQTAIRNWTVEQGEILECRLDSTQDSYKPYVRYSYIVGGQSYQMTKSRRLITLPKMKNMRENLLHHIQSAKPSTCITTHKSLRIPFSKNEIQPGSISFGQSLLWDFLLPECC